MAIGREARAIERHLPRGVDGLHGARPGHPDELASRIALRARIEDCAVADTARSVALLAPSRRAAVDQVTADKLAMVLRHLRIVAPEHRALSRVDGVTTLQALVVKSTPSLTSDVASSPRSVWRSTDQASPSRKTVFSSICRSGLWRCSEYVLPVFSHSDERCQRHAAWRRRWTAGGHRHRAHQRRPRLPASRTRSCASARSSSARTRSRTERQWRHDALESSHLLSVS